jgi:F-type H+-transporting ATPase subunit delta
MSDAVAERYARAICEVGKEAGKLELVGQHFADLAAAYSSSADLRAVLSDPLADEASRTRVLQAIASRLGSCPEALNSVRVMMRRRRLAELPAVARRLNALVDEHRGVLRASLISAKPLSESYCAELTRELSTLTGRNVVLDRSTDASLLAGVVLHLGSHTIDGSLKSRLYEFEKKLAPAS